MRILLTIIVLGLALGLNAKEILSKKQKNFFHNRRIAVSRDTETLPGYVITHWERNGKPDTKGEAVTTNKISTLVGKAQANPLWGDAHKMRDLRKSSKKAQKHREKILKNIQKAIDKADDADDAEFYQMLIRIINNEL